MAHETRSRTLDPDDLGPLERWLAATIGATNVRIGSIDLMSGGAVGENWRLVVDVEDGDHAGNHVWALRTDAPSGLPMSLDRASEFACLKAARSAGVLAPEPIADCDDPSVIGASFMISGFLKGVAQARKIVRNPNIADFGEPLAEALGTELAKLHKISPPRSDLPFLTVPAISPARAAVAELRQCIDSISAARPALEYALCWLDANAPETRSLVLCHGDFRSGNYLVDHGRLTGLLDWEFTHWGDAQQDLGWFCARCWRFGEDDREAGGIAGKDALYRGYNAVADEPLDPATLAYWEILAAAKWSTIALLQGERHLSGREPSLEFMLTGLMAGEMEYDALTEISVHV